MATIEEAYTALFFAGSEVRRSVVETWTPGQLNEAAEWGCFESAWRKEKPHRCYNRPEFVTNCITTG